MKLFLIPNPDPPHNLMTRYPAYNDQLRPVGLTDDEFLQLSIERNKVACSIPVDTPIYIVENTDLPASGDYFFDAWEWDGSAVAVNMTKARAIHLGEIRRVRNGELVKEDVTFMRAIEAEDTDAQATIKTKKQTLRDLPATFDITTDVDTPEKLKAKWPTELPARE
jgi:hypothetical protein